LVLRPQFFQILKTVQGQDQDQDQDQDRFGQDQDIKKRVLRPRPVLRTTSLDGASYTSKHVVTIVFIHDSPHHMEVQSPLSKLRKLT